jgi:hypothetical protein
MKRRLLAPFFGGLIALVCAEPLPVSTLAAAPVEAVAHARASDGHAAGYTVDSADADRIAGARRP